MPEGEQPSVSEGRPKPRFESESVAEFSALVPERVFRLMSEEEAKRALHKVAAYLEAIALPYRRAGDLETAKDWEERAEAVRQALAQVEPSDQELELLLDEINRYEQKIQVEKNDRRQPPTKKRFNQLSRDWNEVTRLRKFLDKRFPPEAA